MLGRWNAFICQILKAEVRTYGQLAEGPNGDNMVAPF